MKNMTYRAKFVDGSVFRYIHIRTEDEVMLMIEEDEKRHGACIECSEIKRCKEESK